MKVKNIIMIVTQENGKQSLILKIIKLKNFSEEVIDSKTGKVAINSGDKIDYLNAKKLANDGFKDILVSKDSLLGKFLHSDIKISDEEDGVLKIGTEINDTIIQKIIDAKINLIKISTTNSINKGPYLLTTILNDKNNTKDEAITEIYKMLRPGDHLLLKSLHKF